MVLHLNIYFRSWQGKEIHSNKGWFSSRCLAPQELPQAAQEALKDLSNGLKSFCIQYVHLGVLIKVFSPQRIFLCVRAFTLTKDLNRIRVLILSEISQRKATKEPF